MSMFDVIIVGGGPAGVSCSIWLKQLGLNPVLVEKQNQCGGLQWSNPYTNTWIATSVNAYGKDVAMAMHENMIRHDVQMRLGQEATGAQVGSSKVSISIASGECLDARYLVLAGGVLPKTGGFTSRVGLIVGPGPSVAKTDVSGARIAILGGGDSAFENHGFIKKRGAASVTIFARTIRARVEMLDRVPPDDVVLGEYQVDKDANTVNGQPFDQILILYGYEPSPQSLLGLDLAMRTDGFVWTNEECVTSNEMVYAIGELARRGHPCCVTSMADGVIAAKSLQRKLESTRAEKFAGMARRAMAVGARVFA